MLMEVLQLRLSTFSGQSTKLLCEHHIAPLIFILLDMKACAPYMVFYLPLP